MAGPDAVRLTQYARGGGCACKIPPGELEETIARLVPGGLGTDLMVGVEHGDDGAVVRVSPAMAVVVTADFFAPVVDDAYTFGRIAAANALSDIYAMGGEPLVAVNCLAGRATSSRPAWPPKCCAAARTWGARHIVM
jgi:selenide,water dikinase